MIIVKSGQIVDILEQHRYEKGQYVYTSQEFVLQDYAGDIIVFTVENEETLKAYNIKVGQEVAVKLELTATIYKGKVYQGLKCIEFFRLVYNPDTTNSAKSKKTKKNKYQPQDISSDDIPL